MSFDRHARSFVESEREFGVAMDDCSSCGAIARGEARHTLAWLEE
jgi:hypothetical protein